MIISVLWFIVANLETGGGLRLGASALGFLFTVIAILDRK